MAIRIIRNEAGNCINFQGSSNPTHWNACLSGEVDANDSTLVNIVNDVITGLTGVKEYEFYNLPFTDLEDKDGNSFADAQEAADYITTNANVIGLSGNGIDLTGEPICFSLDATSTSVMTDHGYAYGVNTIKAVADGGQIKIVSNEGSDSITYFHSLNHTDVCVDGASVSGGLNDVINVLNELFTVGAFESVVISDPYSTMIADVSGVAAGYTLEGSAAIDPAGNDIAGSDGSGANYAGLKSTATIDQAGEYYTFDIRGEGQIGFGLVHSDASYAAGHYSGNATYADPAQFAVGNSAHSGYQFSHHFHQTPNGSWTNYGANTAYSMQAGWYNWDAQADWLAGNPIKIRVGLDTNGYISIESLMDDGTWRVHARTTYPVVEGSEFHLGVKMASAAPRVYSAPMVHLLEPAAPTMYFRYIESPDGVFHYPLFVTAEEAEYYDEIHNSLTAGTGSSHTHTYADDPTNTTWYMPEASHDAAEYQHSSAPSATTFNGNPVTYTEVTSLTNSDLTPSAFSASDITQEEGTAVNIQVTPAGASWSSSVAISPAGSGLVYDGYSLVQGTLTDVGSDTTYTLTVTRANAYGSSVGSMTVTATDVAPVQTNDTPWTKALDFSGSNEHTKQVSSSTSANAIRMGGTSWTAAAPTTGGYTSNDTNARPWATAMVVSSDGHNSNQHIWNLGEGTATGADNIYLRTDQFGALYFGWGREGSGYNEHLILANMGTGTYGIYIAHDGRRMSASDATSTNLNGSFRFKVMFYSGGSWIFNPNPTFGGQGSWSSTGARMDRAVDGDFTIGGRGSNRNFHGKVASMVVTSLDRNVAMPTNAEIEMMITDPVGWLNDYKVGNTYRQPHSYFTYNFALNNNGSAYATQVWLMGDGSNDSYANGIRNYVANYDQNITKLQFNNMLSSDIVNVNIAGLS